MDSLVAGSEVAELREWLTKSSGLRAASLFLALPSAAARTEMLELAATLPDERRDTLREFGQVDLAEWESEYHRVLGPGGCPAIESSYEENALAGRGPVLAVIAGFYEAWGYRPLNPGSETPDHLSIELGFLSYLALKVAFALQANRHEESGIAMDAYEQFRRDHPAHWIGKFGDRLGQFGSALYTAAAGWTETWICSHPRNA